MDILMDIFVGDKIRSKGRNLKLVRKNKISREKGIFCRRWCGSPVPRGCATKNAKGGSPCNGYCSRLCYGTCVCICYGYCIYISYGIYIPIQHSIITCQLAMHAAPLPSTISCKAGLVYTLP